VSSALSNLKKAVKRSTSDKSLQVMKEEESKILEKRVKARVLGQKGSRPGSRPLSSRPGTPMVDSKDKEEIVSGSFKEAEEEEEKQSLSSSDKRKGSGKVIDIEMVDIDVNHEAELFMKKDDVGSGAMNESKIQSKKSLKK